MRRAVNLVERSMFLVEAFLRSDVEVNFGVGHGESDLTEDALVQYADDYPGSS
jgi:hypothetical protein